MSAALIVAAGRGSRAAAGARRPKQYWPIGGAPMLARTIAAFAGHPRIDDVLVVIHPEDEALYRAASAPYARAPCAGPVAGGARRQDLVRAGLEALASIAPSSVLIHDAARPFVPAELIDRVIDSLGAHQGALPALPVTDSLKRAEGARVTGTVARESLWQAQTPQGFAFDPILAAHRAAAEREPAATSPTTSASPNGSASMSRSSKVLQAIASSQRPRMFVSPTSCCSRSARATPARSASRPATTSMRSAPAMR